MAVVVLQREPVRSLNAPGPHNCGDAFVTARNLTSLASAPLHPFPSSHQY